MADLPMSEYENRAYERLTAPPQESRTLVPRWARDTASQVERTVRNGASKVPGTRAIGDAYATAARSMMDFTTSNGLHSVSLTTSIKSHQKMGHDVERSDDFRRLDLRQCDELLPNRKRIHQLAALTEGAASSLMITGATVSTTVSGGATAAVALGTVSVDSVVVMAGLGRVIGEVAVSYGYDPNLPEEELFALQVLGLGMAVGSGARATALASLSRLTQDMMRHATWTRLNEHVLVAVINRAFSSMGLKLTQKKLAQVVPIAGIFISSGMNLHLLNRVHEAANQAYRLRFLREKYDLDASTSVVLQGAELNSDEGIVNIETLLSEAVRKAEAENSRSDQAVESRELDEDGNAA
jgi:hypothetical protein